MLREIIKTRISDDCGYHRMDNTFIRWALQDTAVLAERAKLELIGVCIDPPYGGGYALVFRDEHGERGWCHVSQALMWHWLEELDLMPPEDVIWDPVVIEAHVWKACRM